MKYCFYLIDLTYVRQYVHIEYKYIPNVYRQHMKKTNGWPLGCLAKG